MSHLPHRDREVLTLVAPLETVRSMSGEQRMLLAFEMSDRVRELAKEGIRCEHPDWTEIQVLREWLKMAFWPEPLPSWLDERLQSAIQE